MKKNPFKIMNIEPGNYSDEALKKNYLELIKKYPPEKRPEKFEEIRSAYNTIKNARSPYEILSLAPVDMANSDVNITIDELRDRLEDRLGIKKAKVNLKKNMLLKKLEEITNDTRD